MAVRMLEEAKTHLEPPGVWFLDKHRMARWSPRSRALLVRTRQRLADHLGGYIPPVCTHVKGHGGVKGAIRAVSSLLGRANYVARFDIASYYRSMSHDVLQSLLRQTGVSDSDCAVVSDYLRLPDTRLTGRGMIAGGGLSPLLGGLYLVPLDRAMVRLRERGQLVCYVRYMDDIVLLTRTDLASLFRTVGYLQQSRPMTPRRLASLDDHALPTSRTPIVPARRCLVPWHRRRAGWVHRSADDAAAHPAPS